MEGREEGRKEGGKEIRKEITKGKERKELTFLIPVI